jgi:PHD/YefM family antitoxin component YafN of YafNO toxin-antitoxin module
MSPGDHYVHPPSLRAFLDGGGDLGSFALLDSLVEAIVVARRLLPPETNQKQAARNRGFVERWFDRHGSEEPVPATQELLAFALWKAECLEDPSLAERFEAALPPETLARALQLVDDLRHVHPLAVHEEVFHWTCRACGETFSRAPAVIVTNTGEDLGYDEDLAYCLGCISIAAAALEAASGIDRVTPALDDERHGLRPLPDFAESEHELVLVDDDAPDELILDDEETVRSEAARLTAQLEASARRMAALEARRAALVRRLEAGRRFRDETSR